MPERRVGLAKSLLPSPKKHNFSSLQHSPPPIQTCPASNGGKQPNAPPSEPSDVLKRWRARHGLGSDANTPSPSKCSVQVGVLHVHDVSPSQYESYGPSSLANSELTRRLAAARSVDVSSPIPRPRPALDSGEDFVNTRGSPEQPAEASGELDASAIRYSTPSHLNQSGELAHATWQQRVYSEIDASLSSSTSTGTNSKGLFVNSATILHHRFPVKICLHANSVYIHN